MGSTKEHLKLTVESPNGTIDCVWWSRGDVPLMNGDKLDIAFAPQVNVFNGITSVQLLLKDVHADGLQDEEPELKQKVLDHRKKTNILAQVDEYMSGRDIVVFAENRDIIETLKPYKNISASIVNRVNAHKSNALMFFDYPAEDDIMQSVMQTVAPDVVHYMNYTQKIHNEDAVLKTFSGMIKYTCNNLNGEFNLTRAASALGVTNEVIETLLEMFEDVQMIKIKERDDNAFSIEFINSIELSKILHTEKYSEYVELMNTINDYKNKFMTMELTV